MNHCTSPRTKTQGTIFPFSFPPLEILGQQVPGTGRVLVGDLSLQQPSAEYPENWGELLSWDSTDLYGKEEASTVAVKARTGMVN